MTSFLPDFFALCCLDGDRWVAVSRAPFGRGFDRRDLLPGDRLHGCDEGGKPSALVDGDRPRRALRAAAARSDTSMAHLPSRSGAIVRINVGAGMGEALAVGPPNGRASNRANLPG